MPRRLANSPRPHRASPATGREPDDGFTLLELMMVVAVLAIVIAFAIPSLINGRIAANEAKTISNLRTFSSLSEQYRFRFGRYASALPDLTASGLMDASLASGTKGGYIYTYSPSARSYTLTADPETPGASGKRYFYVDQRGVIRFSSTGTATGTSLPVDG